MRSSGHAASRRRGAQRRNGDAPMVSRRVALGAAVGVGAVAISGVSYVASAKESDPGAIAGPLVVHVKDLKSGRLEMFVAGGRIEVRDKDLAAKLVRAAAKHR
jgi:hypothetical protein